jgi:hypothetical protein
VITTQQLDFCHLRAYLSQIVYFDMADKLNKKLKGNPGNSKDAAVKPFVKRPAVEYIVEPHPTWHDDARNSKYTSNKNVTGQRLNANELLRKGMELLNEDALRISKGWYCCNAL